VKNNKTVIAFALALITACTDAYGENPAEGALQPAEDEAVQTAAEAFEGRTLLQLGRVAEEVSRENPEATDSELRELMVQKIEDLPASESQDKSIYLPINGQYITWSEAQLLAQNPGNVFATYDAAQGAQTWAEREFPGMSQISTIADAYRHARWNADMCKRLGVAWATTYASAHESESSGLERDMDLANNAVGRRVCSSNAQLFLHQIDTLLLNYPRRFVNSPSQMSPSYLVFIR
jgi:hypothetical protein